MSYLTSRPAKRQKIFRDLCESFGYGEPTFTYLEKTLWGPFQVGVTMEVLGVSVKGSGQSGKSAKNNAVLRMMYQIKKSARSGESLMDVDNESLVDCCEWMEKYSNLCEEMTRIDPLLREPNRDLACLELSRCLRRRGLAPIYHCVQSEGTGPTLRFVMSCYTPGFLTSGVGPTIEMAKNVAAREVLVKMQQLEQE